MTPRHRIVIAKEGLSGLSTILRELDPSQAEIVAFYEEPPLLDHRTSGLPVDVWLLDLRMLRRVLRSRPEEIERIARAGTIVVVLSEKQLPRAQQYVEYIDGFVLIDQSARFVNDVLLLARSQHSLWPIELTSFVAVNRRLSAVEALSRSERAILVELGNARSNLAISLQLELPEATVKALVRSVLSKLGFANRTEAAVFAVRHRIGLGRSASAGHDPDFDDDIDPS
jgi:DNA-binding NarL/FixJ family response regulator